MLGIKLEHSATLLPGILQEASQAKKDTMWTEFPSAVRLDQQSQSISPTDIYLYVPSFGETRKQTAVRNQRSPGQRGRSPKQAPPPPQPSKPSPIKPPPPKETPPEESEHPREIIMHDEQGEPWTLRCVCNVKSGDGLLVVCEQCGCWQHAICLGLNNHTIPEKYICDVCSNKKIRCRCGRNLSFRFALIKCTKCGNYVHKRCEGLGYGNMPKGDFVCYFCGRSNFHYEMPHMNPNIHLDDNPITFTQPKIEDLLQDFSNSPFTDFIKNDLADQTLNARDFCELLYDKFRSYFYVAHPRYTTQSSKKKRNRLVISFLTAIKYLCKQLYDMSEDIFKAVFNSLITNDIYKPHQSNNDEIEKDIEFTENAQVDIQHMNQIVKFTTQPRPASLRKTEDGVVAATDLACDQFICVLEGLIGDLEEFNVEDKVDTTLFQITDTRFVLDASRIPSSVLHLMPRSMYGNCSIKLFQYNGTIMAGLFALRNHLATSPDDVPTGIKAGIPLTLGVDWIPAIIDDVSRYLSWTFSDEEESSAPPEPKFHRTNSANSITAHETPHFSPAEATKLKKQQAKRLKEIEQGKKKQRRKPRSKLPNASTEILLFPLLMSDSPGDLLFTVVDDLEMIQAESQEIVSTIGAIHVRADNAPKRNLPTGGQSSAKMKHSCSAESRLGRGRPRTPEASEPSPNDSDDNDTATADLSDEEKEEKEEKTEKTEDQSDEENDEQEKEEENQKQDSDDEKENQRSEEEKENDHQIEEKSDKIEEKSDKAEENQHEEEENKAEEDQKDVPLFDDEKVQKIVNSIQNDLKYKAVKTKSPAEEMKSIFGL